MLKHTEKDINEFLRLGESTAHAKHCDQKAAATTEFVKAVRKIFARGETTGEEGEEVQEEQAAPVGFVPDIIADNKLIYSWAGLDFGDYNCLLMQKTLKALANNTAATNVRFWGKIVGTERDYFIAEGVAEDANPPEEEENAEPKEARGTGVNTFAYWVCNNPAGDWVALPDLYPSDIKASRDIKMSFTGQLDRKLFSNPFFFKTEAVYLRAQIARICHSTTLVPRNVMRL